MRIFFLLILFFSFTNSFSQTKTTCFTLGGSTDDNGYSIIQTKDSGYAIAGSTLYGFGNLDVYVAKLDKYRNLQWTKTIGGTSDDYGYSIIQTNDDGYAVAGYTQSFGAGGYDMYVIKLSSGGSVQWTKTFGGTDMDYGYSIIQTKDGGYAIAGNSYSFDPSGDMYVVKLNSSGNLQWSKSIGGSMDDYGYSIIQTKDTGFAIAGYSASYDPSYDIYLVKLSSAGGLQWSKSIGGTGEDYGRALVQTSDGGYAIGGYSNSFDLSGNYSMSIVKTNSLGNFQWGHSFSSSTNNNYYGYSISQANDGGFVAGGNILSSSFDQLLTVKVNSSGTFQWAKSYDYGDGYSLVQTNDAGFALCGSNYGSVGFIKMDSNGNSCCANVLVPLDSAGGASVAMPDTLKNIISIAGTGGIDSSGGQITIACEECTPPMPINVSPDVTICLGHSAQLSISVSGGSPPYTYSWSPGTWLSDSTIVNPVATPTVTGWFTYTVTVTDSKGCFKDTVTTVSVNPSATTTINGNKLLCVGDSTKLYVASGQLSYLWSTGGTDTLITVSPSATSLYSVIIANYFGCTDTTTDTVTVFPCTENFITENCLTIGGASNEQGNSVVHTKDGGFMIAGYTESFGVGNRNIYLMKLNLSGTMLWSKTFGGTGIEEANSIIQTKDSGFAISGSTTSFAPANAGVQTYVLKLNSLGNVQWEKSLGGSGNDVGYSIIQTKDTGYVSAGTFLSSVTSSNNMQIVKLNQTGNVQWANAIGTTSYEEAHAIIQTTDGGYAATGLTTFNNAYGQIYFVKLNASGNVQWTKIIGGGTNGIGEDSKSVIQTTDGGYILGGTTASYGAGKSDFFMVKLDVSGNLKWSKTFGGTNDEFLKSLIKTSDGGYAMCGETYSYGDTANGLSNAYLVKTDSLGNSQWARTFGGSDGEGSLNIIQDNHRNYITVGYASSPSNGNDVYLIKLDSTGKNCCSSIAGCITHTVVPFDVSGGTPTVSSGAGVVMPGSSQFAHGGIIQSACCPDFPPPIITGNTYICKGNSTTLTTSGGTSYSWNTGATTSSITVSPSVTTNYLVTSFDVSGCSKSTNVAVIVDKVNPSITVVNASCPTCCDASVMASVTSGSPPFSYQWSGGQTTQSISGLCAGTSWTMCVTDAKGCVTCDSVSISYATGMQQLFSNEHVIAYPNPTNGIINISAPQNTTEIFITDIVGKKIYQNTIPIRQSPIDISAAPAGIYFLNVKFSNGVVVKKIVKL